MWLTTFNLKQHLFDLCWKNIDAFDNQHVVAAAAGFFALLWAWMFNKTSLPLHDLLIRRGVLVIPFLFAMTDWLENIGFLIVVFAYPQEYRAIGTLSGTLKGIKPFIEIVIVLLTLVFVASTLWALKRRKQN
jgi:cbb3-type cytochrome oxidase subunit 3